MASKKHLYLILIADLQFFYPNRYPLQNIGLNSLLPLPSLNSSYVVLNFLEVKPAQFLIIFTVDRQDPFVCNLNIFFFLNSSNK